MGSFSIAVALLWAMAIPLPRWSYVGAITTENCIDTCNKYAAWMAGEGVGLADISQMCAEVCAVVDAQSGTPCGEALLGCSTEHLALLAYSSGHVLESVAILLGATLNASEDAAFIANLHLNDRGSPESCSDIDGAHYCVGQVPLVASLGLCLPTSCDSTYVLALVGNLTSMLPNGTSSIISSRSSSTLAGAPLGEPYFTCGNELRFGIDAGTIAMFCLIVVLAALAVIGTASDYHRRQSQTHEGANTYQKAGQAIEPRECHTVSGPTTPSGGTGNAPPSLSPKYHVEEGQTIGAQTAHGNYRVPQIREDPACEPMLSSEPAAEAEHPLFPSDPIEEHQGEGDGHDSSESRRGYHQGSPRGGDVVCWVECLECFSLIKSTEKLLAPPRWGDEFHALNGVRALSLLWVVLGHTAIFTVSYGAGYSNVNDILPHDGSGFLARWTAQVIPGGFLSVDTFFLMSGFLVSCVLLPKLDTMPSGQYLWIAKAYLHRYFRLTPTLAFVMLVTWKILPLLGDGPTWWTSMVAQGEACSKYWWTEVTYLSNVIPWPPLSGGCLGVSWYLANDTQFFIVAMPLVALFHRRPHVGTLVVLLMLAASCLYSLLWIGFHKGVLFSIFTSTDGWSEAYGEPWSRCPVYLIGLLCGFLWHTRVRGPLSIAKKEVPTSSHDKTAINPTANTSLGRFMNPKITVSVAITTATLLALPVYGSYWAYQDAVEPGIPAWVDHLYLAFSRPAWALGVAGMCALCFTGRGGMVNWILTWPVWMVVSRLTYCAYLTHPLLLTWLYADQLTPVKFTALEYAVTFMGCTVGSFSGAIALHLLVEAPFRNLESWARKRGEAKERT